MQNRIRKVVAVISQGIKGLRNNSINPREIAAIGVDGTSWACIPVDKTGCPYVLPCSGWTAGAQKQADWMKERSGEERLIE